MDFRSFLQENIVCLDGGMGTLLQARGLRPGERPETWCLTHPAEVEECHRAYYDAGSNVVSTNTFGASLLHFSREELGRIVPAAVELVRSAAARSTGAQPKFVALDMGPSGKLLRPLGDLDFEDAVAVFAETVRLGAAAGADLIFIETMNDSYETKAALLAAKENADLPVMVSNAYGADGKLMTGANPAAMVSLLEGLGAEAVGLNCSLGPEALAPLAEEYVRLASVPVLFKPNAGLPEMRDGRTVFNVAAGPFADTVTELVKKGVRIAGGCCGTTPEYIAALHERLQGLAPRPVTKKDRFVVSSGTHAVTFGDDLVVIGERLNPTGKKRVKEALRSGDQAFLLEEAKAALQAAKENGGGLPVFVSNSCGANGRLLTGARPEDVIPVLESMGAEAVGLNCSLGPEAMAAIAEEYLRLTSLPVIFKPNAGLPKLRHGRTVYDVGPQEFAEAVAAAAGKGVRLVGGCCGTTPEHIAALTAELKKTGERI